MKGKAVSFGLPYLAVIAGVAGYFFHAALRSGGSSVPLIAFSILMCLLFLLGAAALEKREAYADVYRKLPSDAVLCILGAIAVAAGCVLSMPGGTTFGKALDVLGILGALGLAAAAVCRAGEKKPQPFFMIPAVLFYAATLFYDFRGWTTDPQIMDYAFSLFALICFMIATYQAAAFCYDHGSRRQLAFFAPAGVLFGVTAMAGAGRGELLIYGGSALWMLACTTQMSGRRSARA